MKYNVPSFLKRSGDSLLFNLPDKEFVFYIPEDYFKTSISIIDGSYLSTLGVCNYCIRDSVTKKDSGIKTFNFPTIFLSKPDRIEKVKGLKLKSNLDETDYRIAIYVLDDEVVSSVKVPQIIDNVETFFKMMLITGKIPTGIRYDEIHNYFKDNINLAGSDYGINMQLFGVVISEICRDPKDISIPFRLTKMEDMSAFKSISIKGVPNYVSPFVSLTSENFDESLITSITMDSDKYSPLEKILTM